MERADAERADRQPLDALRLERLLELRRLRSVDEPPGEQQEHAVGRRAFAARTRARSPRTRRATGRRRRASRTGALSASACRAVRTATPSVAGSTGCPEPPRASSATSSARRLGAAQGGQHLVEDVLEEIAEPDVREPALGLGRPRREHAQAPPARSLDAREPERRLADPRLALEHERGRPLVGAVDEGVERGELLVPADDLPGRHEAIVRASSVLERIPSFA